jgi:hypothetical protein
MARGNIPTYQEENGISYAQPQTQSTQGGTQGNFGSFLQKLLGGGNTNARGGTGSLNSGGGQSGGLGFLSGGNDTGGPDLSQFGGLAGRGGEGSAFDFGSLGGGGDGGGFNFGGLSQGIGAATDIIGALMSMKQLALGQESLDHQIGLDNANFANQTAVAQRQIDQQGNMLAIEGAVPAVDTQLQATLAEKP